MSTGSCERAGESSVTAGSAVREGSAVIVGSQRGEVLFRPAFRGPAQGQLAERLELLERQRGVAVQLQDGEEAGDHDAGLVDAGDLGVEIDPALCTQAIRIGVPVVQLDVDNGLDTSYLAGETAGQDGLYTANGADSLTDKIDVYDGQAEGPGVVGEAEGSLTDTASSTDGKA